MSMEIEPVGSPLARCTPSRGIPASPQNGRAALFWFERRVYGNPTSYVLSSAEVGGDLFAFVLPRPDGGWSWATRGFAGAPGVGGPHPTLEAAQEEAEAYVRLTPKLEPLS